MPKQDLAERARAAATTRRAPTVAPSQRQDGVAVPRKKLVKLTLEIAPAVHRDFKTWLDAAAQNLELPTVHGKAVFRALLAELLADDQLAERVRRRVIADRS